jgi:hypothetical protein
MFPLRPMSALMRNSLRYRKRLHLVNVKLVALKDVFQVVAAEVQKHDSRRLVKPVATVSDEGRSIRHLVLGTAASEG